MLSGLAKHAQPPKLPTLETFSTARRCLLHDPDALGSPWRMLSWWISSSLTSSTVAPSPPPPRPVSGSPLPLKTSGASVHREGGPHRRSSARDSFPAQEPPPPPARPLRQPLPPAGPSRRRNTAPAGQRPRCPAPPAGPAAPSQPRPVSRCPLTCRLRVYLGNRAGSRARGRPAEEPRVRSSRSPRTAGAGLSAAHPPRSPSRPPPTYLGARPRLRRLRCASSGGSGSLAGAGPGRPSDVAYGGGARTPEPPANQGPRP